MTLDRSTYDTSVQASGGRSPQSIWSLAVSTVLLYRRFWKEFLLASGSAFGALWIALGVSSALGYDLRDVGSGEVWAAAFWLGIFMGYYAIVLLTIVASEASQKGSISMWQAYRSSLPGLLASAGALAGMALAMVIVLIVPLVGLVAALYAYVRLSVGLEMAVLERLDPLTAMRRAWNLTKGRFWISAMHAVLQHGYLLALAIVIALLPYVATVVVWVALALPAFVILRVLSYLDLGTRQRLDIVPSHDTIR